ncbi:MAG: monooxygenase, partial [Rhodobacteraceae bacterium]|nr:monooxygenase [Paracoccaceae bacterium]
MTHDAHIAIVGAGIGGLTAALCFRHFGYRVDVFEKSPELKEVGAGIQISPNALRVFEKLGLDQRLKEDGLQAQAIQLMKHAPSRAVARLYLAKSRAQGGYYLFHRADLLTVLVDACADAGVPIHLGQSIDGPTSLQQHNFDLIVGADGLHSNFRKLLNPCSRAFFTGQIAWRSVVENVIAQPAEARVHMGPHRHIVTYPIRGGRDLNVVCIKEQADWSDEGWNHPDDPSILKQEFGDFSGLLPVFDQVHTLHKWGL